MPRSGNAGLYGSFISWFFKGISILPSYITDKLQNAENLVFVPLIGDGEYEQIIAVWKKENQSPALMHFLEYI